DGKFANAACVAGVNLDRLIGKQVLPLEALDWLENLERQFYEYSDGFNAPFCSIKDFINREVRSRIVESSYPLGLKPAALWDLLPSQVSSSIREGLKDFSRKIKEFAAGNIIGLDSKSSSPIQVLREENYRCAGFENLYVAGEGSGYSGGIISSGADGIKAAMAIINKG
ncbi:MAG: FAD-dependent oxidoreductase, partial [Candidatus Omnitrophica bacterium]|nr:FAD-dependent oxidoreductase [Candidatus Omnitrophota bacterium]